MGSKINFESSNLNFIDDDMAEIICQGVMVDDNYDTDPDTFTKKYKNHCQQQKNSLVWNSEGIFMPVINRQITKFIGLFENYLKEYIMKISKMKLFLYTPFDYFKDLVIVETNNHFYEPTDMY